MAGQSAGILLYRVREGELQALLIHPGGPFWANRDAGAWSIPKGEIGRDEAPISAAKREFEEETGAAIEGKLIELTPVMQKGGKIVHAWAVEGDFDPAELKSNSFSLEWPPKSGKIRSYPEADRAEWFGIAAAREKINPGQVPLLTELVRKTGLAGATAKS